MSEKGVGSTTGTAGDDQDASLFRYTPLTKGQIRLLQLDPANQETDQLHGKLVVKSFDNLPPRVRPHASGLTEPIDPGKHVCFEATSYVWGQATFTESLITPQGSIPIMASLASILRRLRDLSRSRTYWADGVCINQSDMAEKEIQVSLMDVIYSSAVRVLCDICEEDEDISLLLDTMERYWKRNMRHGFAMSQGDSMNLSAKTTAKVMGVSLPTDEESDAIQEMEGNDWPVRYLKLMSSPWFHRVWVVQEFVLGRDAHMMFGRRHVPWGELWAGMIRYKGIDWPWDSADFASADMASLLISFNSMCLVRTCRFIDPKTSHGREFNGIAKVLMCGLELDQAQLPMCLIFFCVNSCTVPRDRYFGILGLVDEEGEDKPKELRADYTSPMRDITMRFWTYALQLGSGGELLLVAGLPGREEGYPSWLRDITAPNPLSHVALGAPLGDAWHKSGGPSTTWSVSFDDQDPDRMFVQGYHLGDIIETSSLDAKEEFDLENLIHWLDRAFSFFTSGIKTIDCSSDTRYPMTSEHIHEAAFKAISNYDEQDATPPTDETFKAILRIGLSLVLVAKSKITSDKYNMSRVVKAFENEGPVLKELFLRIYASRGFRFCKASKGIFAHLPRGFALITDLFAALVVGGSIAYLTFQCLTLSVQRRPPPGPKPLPLIGNARDFPAEGVPEYQHWLLHKDLYGPISSVTIKTSGRPSMTFANKLCGYGRIVLCQGYNSTFRRYRKLLHQELGTRVSAAQFQDAQEVEVNRQLARALDEPDKWLEHIKTTAASTVLKMTYGYAVEPQGPDTLVDLIERMMTEFSLAAVPFAWLVDLVPMLQHLPEYFPGAKFKKTARKWRESIRAVAYIPYRFVQRQIASDNYRPSYVSKLVHQCEQDGPADTTLCHDDEEAIAWSAASLYGAAADTTVITLTTFTLAMVLFPQVQLRAQNEIDSLTGSNRLPSFQDRDRLPYINALVKETLRWWPIAPMGFPHTADEDIQYNNIHIPKGAYLLPAVWWFLHDPAVYAEPQKFDPERFLSPRNEPDPSSEVFGYGRRICPGRFFADASLYLNIVKCLAAFNIKRARDQNGEEMAVDVRPKPGILSYPTEFLFEITPRSQTHVELIRRMEAEVPQEEGDAELLESLEDWRKVEMIEAVSDAKAD
ncbi:hypothetical protein FSARC_14568 [Fusarium sarcochroum]|uniref:Heterokaryon incompatibility domain-containing protein n=1 Tax=Fusarium sarcochroum TaxID=1208366 RepID=A0A8H4WP24_9HYPO|nr:hypothetical protein FSARC_14568 [Fusarium sarcochroum]